jgi:hypothetical protein
LNYNSMLWSRSRFRGIHHVKTQITNIRNGLPTLMDKEYYKNFTLISLSAHMKSSIL